jgi:DnaJ-domain-containing protein 1
VSLTDRLIGLAKSNLNALLERAAEQVDPRRKLAGVSDAELEAELLRRRATHESEARVSAARAKVDAEPARQAPAQPPGGVPKDRADRERVAREREAKVRAERAARERAQKERTRPGAGAKASASSAGPRPHAGREAPRRSVRGQDPEMAKYYARLEVAYGSDFDAVKSAYRRLMRKYHPDLHGASPEKHKAATEVSQALTQAYNELERLLCGGPNQR